MESFEYKIKDGAGIHARPAGLLVKKASCYNSDITLKKDEKKADAKKIFALMGMVIKCGDTITVEINGEDEKNAFDDLKKFFEENL